MVRYYVYHSIINSCKLVSCRVVIFISDLVQQTLVHHCCKDSYVAFHASNYSIINYCCMKVHLSQDVIVLLLKLTEICVSLVRLAVNGVAPFGFICLVLNLGYVYALDFDSMVLLDSYTARLFHFSDFSVHYGRFETFLVQKDSVFLSLSYVMVVRCRICYSKDDLGSWWSGGSVRVLFGWFLAHAMDFNFCGFVVRRFLHWLLGFDLD